MRRTKRIAVGAAGLSLLTLLTACGGSESGTPQGAKGNGTTTSAATSSAAASQAAPSVTDPKDAGGLAPCDLLKPDRAIAIGLEPEGTEVEPTGRFAPCNWRTSDRAFAVDVSADTTWEGMDELYDRQDMYAEFEPLEIDGYPAVRVGLYSDPAQCEMFVGIAETQAILVQGTRGPGQTFDTCAKVREVAQAVLASLPAGK
ncbi:MAG TPA: DUF3558 domain-containing protein [Pseudonocardiaceae bacterium]